MPPSILIVPDKFKGTLSAEAAARAIARGWRSVRRYDSLELLPMSDGGDGFGAVMAGLMGGRPVRIETVDAAHQPCKTSWWWEPASQTAVIASAGIIGLALLPPRTFHPFALDTFGLGAVLRAAAARGARRCLIGIGGSATNDGGFGMARALGWQFRDACGNQIGHWTELHRLAEVCPPKRRSAFKEAVVAVDVRNRLLGSEGATRIYGPQKGLRRQDFELAENCLRRLAFVLKQKLHEDFSRSPGAGAAGGLGFGLMAFLGARVEAGFDLFARLARLDERVRRSDLVITGEGACDESTFMGKGVGEIARSCRRWNVPCVALVGKINAAVASRNLFSRCCSLTQSCTPAQAMAQPAIRLERLARKLAGDWNPRRNASDRRKRRSS